MKIEFKEAAASAHSGIKEKLDDIVVEKVMEELENFKSVVGETGVDDLREDLMETWKQEGCEASAGNFNF